MDSYSSVGWLVETCIYLLCEDTEYRLEADRDGWDERERANGIRMYEWGT